MTIKPMVVIRLEAENVKRIEAVEIVPEEGVVEIAGRNAQGKTSVLDSITFALAGERAIQAKPLRKGATKGKIVLDLGDKDGMALRVTRTFTPDGGGSLRVEDPSGKLDGPQAILNSIMGKTTLDPLAFARSKPAERLAIMRAMVPGVDFDAIAKARQMAYDQRTDRNREAKSLRTRASAISVADKPEEPVDTAAVLEELSAVAAAGREYERLKAERQRIDGELARLDKEAADKRNRAQTLIDEAGAMEVTATALRRRMAKFPKPTEPPDGAALRQRLADAERINEAFRRSDERLGILMEAATAEKEAELNTATIEKLDQRVRDAIALANLPVRAMSLGEDDVLLDGLPFDQASDAQQLRASVAVAMSQNPDLRVIRIRDGSLLDDDAMAILREVANDEGFQMWIERVNPSSPSAIIIEDGRVKPKAAE